MDKPVAQQAAQILEKLLELTREMAAVNLDELSAFDEDADSDEQASDAIDTISGLIARRQSLLDSLEQLKQGVGGAQALRSDVADALLAQILTLDTQVNQSLSRRQQQVIDQIGRVVSERKQLQRQKEAVIFEPGTLLDIKK